MIGIGRATVMSLLLVLVAGCVAPPRPFVDEFYAPLRIRPDASAAAANAASAVAVFSFADERPDTEPNVVLLYEPYDGRPRVERSTVPVGQGVARAFARGLQLRGFNVVDATAQRYQPGTVAGARAIVTGRVAEFGVKLARTGFIGGYQQRVAVRVALDVYDGTTGRRVAERTYQHVVEGAMKPDEPMFLLARAMAEIVEQAMKDRELLNAVRS